MLVTLLLGCARHPVQSRRLTADRDVFQVADIDRVSSNQCDIIVIEVNHSLRKGDDGRGIAGRDGLVLTDSNHDRTAPPSYHDPVGMVRAHHRNTKGAFNSTQCGAGCFQ